MSVANFLFGEKCDRCQKRSHGLELFEQWQTCESCKKSILWKRKRENAMKGDPVVDCPLCATTMEKKFIFDDELAIRDKCPKCEAVFLSAEELEAIKKHSYRKGKRAGQSSGNSSGFTTGFVVGSIIN